MSTFFELARNYNFDTIRSQPQSNVHNLNQTFTTSIKRSQPLSNVHNLCQTFTTISNMNLTGFFIFHHPPILPQTQNYLNTLFLHHSP